MTLVFGRAGNDDNVLQNAIKHALWSYQLTQQFGPDKAKRITDAHERGQADPLAVIMDLNNNEVGRNLALDPKNETRSALSVVWEAYKSGRLVLSPPKPPQSAAS